MSGLRELAVSEARVREHLLSSGVLRAITAVLTTCNRRLTRPALSLLISISLDMSGMAAFARLLRSCPGPALTPQPHPYTRVGRVAQVPYGRALHGRPPAGPTNLLR
jgi:hypothetical protein